MHILDCRRLEKRYFQMKVIFSSREAQQIRQDQEE